MAVKPTTLIGVLLGILLLHGCATTSPRPEEVGQIRSITIARMATPPLRLPTFAQGFFEQMGRQYPSLLSAALAPGDEGVAQLKPPEIPDFGAVLANTLDRAASKAFARWPKSRIHEAHVTENFRDETSAVVLISITEHEAAWTHGHLMAMVQVKLYSAAGEILMNESVALNGLYTTGSRKLQVVLPEGRGALAKEYESGSTELAERIVDRLRRLGFQ